MQEAIFALTPSVQPDGWLTVWTGYMVDTRSSLFSPVVGLAIEPAAADVDKAEFNVGVAHAPLAVDSPADTDRLADQDRPG